MAIALDRLHGPAVFGRRAQNRWEREIACGRRSEAGPRPGSARREPRYAATRATVPAAANCLADRRHAGSTGSVHRRRRRLRRRRCGLAAGPGPLSQSSQSSRRPGPSCTGRSRLRAARAGSRSQPRYVARRWALVGIAAVAGVTVGWHCSASVGKRLVGPGKALEQARPHWQSQCHPARSVTSHS